MSFLEFVNQHWDFVNEHAFGIALFLVIIAWIFFDGIGDLFTVKFKKEIHHHHHDDLEEEEEEAPNHGGSSGI